MRDIIEILKAIIGVIVAIVLIITITCYGVEALITQLLSNFQVNIYLNHFDTWLYRSNRLHKKTTV